MATKGKKDLHKKTKKDPNGVKKDTNKNNKDAPPKRKPTKPTSMLDAIQRKRREALTVLDENMVKSALIGDIEQTKGGDLEAPVMDESTVGQQVNNQTRRAYAAKLRRAIADADVVIEVIDARDPAGYRDAAVEDEILLSGKKLVLLLNKCDLIPDTQCVDDWAHYLKKFHPCVAFRSMTTASRSKHATLDFADHRVATCPSKLLKSGYEPIGARELMGVLNNYARAEKLATPSNSAKQPTNDTDMADTLEDEEQGDKEPSTKAPVYKKITVAVIGMPNVGKSSVINSLCRNSGKVQTGNEAGITKKVSRIKLSNHIDLLDTPGVILTGDENDPAAVIKGCVKNFTDETAERAVDMLRAIPTIQTQLMKLYNLSTEEATHASGPAFLSLVAQKKGLLKAGGARNLSGAARSVIDDWQKGKLIAFSKPPAVDHTVQPVEIVAPAPAMQF
eukprot:Protomagalhaensia_wolfi_Nauph_80__629@NODE_1359_length_1566_cov_6_621480_g1051_i0_p1_GENE_NODE_1359_length_1566_cov_6_621480_g1051_i0NODE_1359_length_1566_cov_6_621480_g1051_i0_p1_ORF_typecomplete_len448_score110_54MMR_HSR1/PF01926_23/12MMR_HSR1/PF01926_23/3_9e14FeoB_N/PF02421_18/0_018FeoB_N/PF02421_18/1_9e10RsgA_GTPase/PF03193_16/0_036RsgA_GTPase/PF03193_16/1_9e07GTP_EFTU/PF00009_27/0_00061GTP_EFTU/PF00009_27/0_004AIG1/PF04548_16/0_0001IIGP/PF05049_13/3_9e03IIGP/PF05049_13/0_00035MnmE_helical/P